MPRGSKVHGVYEALLGKGYTKGKSARISQAKTGQALATGRPPKRPRPRKKRQPKKAESLYAPLAGMEDKR